MSMKLFIALVALLIYDSCSGYVLYTCCAADSERLDMPSYKALGGLRVFCILYKGTCWIGGIF
jgi:hypothetical protein